MNDFGITAKYEGNNVECQCGFKWDFLSENLEVVEQSHADEHWSWMKWNIDAMFNVFDGEK